MVFDCTGSSLPEFMMIAAGLSFLAIGLTAWFRPDPPLIRWLCFQRYPDVNRADVLERALGLTRQTMGPVALWHTRIVATLGGLLFAGVGVAILVADAAQCGHLNLALHLPRLTSGIRIKFFWPMVPFAVIAFVLGLYQATKLRSLKYQLAFLALITAWALASGEAAAFHVGSDANKWAIIAFASFFVAALVAWTGRRKE